LMLHQFAAPALEILLIFVQDPSSDLDEFPLTLAVRTCDIHDSVPAV